MIYCILKNLSILILKVFFKIRVYGAENLPKKGGFILASNHLSYLDPVVVGASCRRSINYMAKEELFHNAWFAWLLRNINVFPVKRKSADLASLKEAMRRIRAGGGLLMFPEGSRSEGKIGEPQGGVGFLAVKLDVPVIPVFLQGTDDAMPKNAKFIKPARISVYFGSKISIERGLPYQDIAKLVMHNIRQLSCPVSN